jgi:hypothetical protein
MRSNVRMHMERSALLVQSYYATCPHVFGDHGGHFQRLFHSKTAACVMHPAIIFYMTVTFVWIFFLEQRMLDELSETVLLQCSLSFFFDNEWSLSWRRWEWQQ